MKLCMCTESFMSTNVGIWEAYIFPSIVITTASLKCFHLLVITSELL